MIIRFKEGVIIKEVNTEFFQLCVEAFLIYDKYNIIPTITSANDGEHIPTSLHYKNLAWDLRIWGLNEPMKVAEELASNLREISKYWQVLYGDDNHLNHFHVEFDINQ